MFVRTESTQVHLQKKCVEFVALDVCAYHHTRVLN